MLQAVYRNETSKTVLIIIELDLLLSSVHADIFLVSNFLFFPLEETDFCPLFQLLRVHTSVQMKIVSRVLYMFLNSNLTMLIDRKVDHQILIFKQGLSSLPSCITNAFNIILVHS